MRRGPQGESHKSKFDDFRARQRFGNEQPDSTPRPHKMQATGTGFSPRNSTGFSPRYPQTQPLMGGHPPAPSAQSYRPTPFNEMAYGTSPRNAMHASPRAPQFSVHGQSPRAQGSQHTLTPGQSPRSMAPPGHQDVPPPPPPPSASPRHAMHPMQQQQPQHQSLDPLDPRHDLPPLPPIVAEHFEAEREIQTQLQQLYRARLKISYDTLSCQLATDHAKALAAIQARNVAVVDQGLVESEARMNAFAAELDRSLSY